MPLHVHHGPRTELLADGLADLLAHPLDDPFAEEVVVVPAKGVERWLTQRLSHRLGAGPRGDDGVCAGVRFLNPRSLVALLTGTEHDDPWDPDRFVWPLLDVVDSSLGEPWCAALSAHLGHGATSELGELRQDRRYSVARRLAGLFASYGEQRPALLTDWAAGRDTDGVGDALPADLAWQPELWRRLIAAVAAPPPDLRHRTVLAQVRDGAPLDLPARLAMFGHTRMTTTELELLSAVGAVREVHLWLLQASPAAWDRLAEITREGPVRRRLDRSADVVRHRVLASLGRDARELQRSLTRLGDVEEHVLGAEEAAAAPGGAFTLLRRVQHQLRADEVGTGAPADPADCSFQVHACHGAARQVEVLRDVLTGLMEDDPTLEPRDILVMCPDIEAYAPLFSATFGLAEAGDGHPGHQLRVRLADRALSSTNPLLQLAGDLVRITAGRATATELLDLASTAPVRHRFGFDDEELAEVAGWVERSGIRWGLTAELRAPYGLDGLEENTWSAGLDRILLGVAAAEGEAHLRGRLPLDDIGSASLDLVGRLTELVDRVELSVDRLRDARTPTDWMEALREGVAGLGDVPVREAWQAAQFDREIESLLASAGDTFAGRLRLADVRALLELRLQPRPTRANFRTGNLTVCTMVPMRSVPHRVVCLVGLDDGVFPRTVVSDGDDVLARDPMTGERDPRSEDRQLLLDAVLAAGETLVVTYTGASITNNQERPPCVPLEELLDAAEAAAPGARTSVVNHHPLQPFDPRNFDASAANGPFSFDVAAGQAAKALQGRRRPPEPFLSGPLKTPTAEQPDVELADLQAFFRHPVGAFLRQRLDVSTPEEHEDPDDAIPLSLRGLDEWQIGDRILRRVLEHLGDEVGTQQVLTGELLRGDLPPRELGSRAVLDVCSRVQSLTQAARDHLDDEPTSRDVTVDLGGGRRLTGVVPDLRGGRIVRVHYSKLAPKHRLEAWIDLLALTAAFPDQHWVAASYGWFKKYGRQGVASSVLGPVADPAAVLRALVDVRDRGLREPIPLFAKASEAWATAVRKADDGADAARRAWEGSDLVPGERLDPAHVRVYGHGTDLDRIVAQPHDQEDWNDEPTRLGRYALRVWDPLVDSEKGKNL